MSNFDYPSSGLKHANYVRGFHPDNYSALEEPSCRNCPHRIQASNKELLAFVDDAYEDSELWYPKLRVEEAGYSMRMTAREFKMFKGKLDYPARSDLLLKHARSEDLLGLLIPGGFMPDKPRRDAKGPSLTREFFEQQKLVVLIHLEGWIPISAKSLQSKCATGSWDLKDDPENAVAIRVDARVVACGNHISSRTPLDLATFGNAMKDFLFIHAM